MNLELRLRELLQACSVPTFVCIAEAIEERYGSNEKDKVVFASVKEVLEDFTLQQFQKDLKQNKITLSQDNKGIAKTIFEAFYQIEGFSSHKNLQVLINRVGLMKDYPNAKIKCDKTG